VLIDHRAVIILIPRSPIVLLIAAHAEPSLGNGAADAIDDSARRMQGALEIGDGVGEDPRRRVEEIDVDRLVVGRGDHAVGGRRRGHELVVDGRSGVGCRK
jgi:hypothetical protein